MAEKTAFERISEGAREALEIARGNQPAARVHMQGHAYVPETELAALRQRIEELERALEGAADALSSAAEEVGAWGAYASDYFQDKHDLEGSIGIIVKQAEAARAALGRKA